MTRHPVKVVLASLLLALSVPAFADGDGHRHHHKHKHHRHYGHDHYRDDYRGGPCRVDGWYDRHGHYRERSVCGESRVMVPVPAPAIYLQPPSVVIQPPGVYLR